MSFSSDKDEREKKKTLTIRHLNLKSEPNAGDNSSNI